MQGRRAKRNVINTCYEEIFFFVFSLCDSVNIKGKLKLAGF